MPSVPAAPVRFSTTACWPVVRVMCSASSRAPRSPMPPAANPVTMRTGLLGQSCADAASGRRASRPQARPPSSTARSFLFSPDCDCQCRKKLTPAAPCPARPSSHSSAARSQFGRDPPPRRRCSAETPSAPRSGSRAVRTASYGRMNSPSSFDQNAASGLTAAAAKPSGAG